MNEEHDLPACEPTAMSVYVEPRRQVCSPAFRRRKARKSPLKPILLSYRRFRRWHRLEATGVEIVAKALRTPCFCIADNAGAVGNLVVNKVAQGKGGFGYNADKDIYEDLIAAGVIDPVKVTRIALQNAASVAGLLLTTDCTVTEQPSDETGADAAAAMGGGGMGGMGGGMPGMGGMGGMGGGMPGMGMM